MEPLRSGDVERVQFETVQRRRDGSTHPVEVRMHLAGSEAPAVIAAVILDISARHAAEQELRGREAENRRLANEQGALRRVATAVAREDDPQSVFDLVCEEAVRLIGAAAAGLVRFDRRRARRTSWARGRSPRARSDLPAAVAARRPGGRGAGVPQRRGRST